MVVVEMDYFSAFSDVPANLCISRVKQCSIYVGIVGFRYGSLVPGLPDTSYTELEQRTAAEAGIPRLVFLLDEDAEFPLRLVDPDRSKQEQFRASLIRSGVTIVKFRDAAGLEALVFQALIELKHHRGQQPEREANQIAANEAMRSAGHRLGVTLGKYAPANISNVPSRNLDFAGRDTLLEFVRRSLKTTRSQAVALFGIGGVGKSQLALEFAHRFGPDYDIVWWVPAGEHQSIMHSISDLARELGLGQGFDQAELVEACLHYLRSNPGWLLIFDNVEHPVNISAYMPGGLGDILITTRDPAWGGSASALKVDVFSRAVSTQFIMMRSGDDDEPNANALADELGDLPLALAHAASFMNETGMPAGQYRRLLDENKVDLLARGALPDYDGTVATTWKLSIDRVGNSAPGSVEILQLLSFLAPDSIPLDLLSVHPEILPQDLRDLTRSPLRFEDCISGLYRYSLVDRDRSGIRIHRLVQSVIRDSLSPGDYDRYSRLAIRLLDADFPDPWNAPRVWSQCGRLMPHILASLEHLDPTRHETALIGFLLRRAATYLWHVAEYNAARRLMERALQLIELGHGSDHPEVGITLRRLGRILRYLGEFALARGLQEKSLRMLTEAYGDSHYEVAASMDDLARTYREMGDFNKALALFQSALEIIEEEFGRDHFEYAVTLRNLGRVRYELGDFAAAHDLLERAVNIVEMTYGPNHPQMGIVLRNFSMVLAKVGSLPRARAVLERACAILEATYGENHPELGMTLMELANVLDESGDAAGAAAARVRADAIAQVTGERRWVSD